MDFVADKTEGSLRILDCGLADYREVLRLQHELAQVTFPHPTVAETLEDAVKDAFSPNL